MAWHRPTTKLTTITPPCPTPKTALEINETVYHDVFRRAAQLALVSGDSPGYRDRCERLPGPRHGSSVHHRGWEGERHGKSCSVFFTDQATLYRVFFCFLCDVSFRSVPSPPIRAVLSGSAPSRPIPSRSISLFSSPLRLVWKYFMSGMGSQSSSAFCCVLIVMSLIVSLNELVGGLINLLSDRLVV